jgi:hypothetical protein
LVDHFDFLSRLPVAEKGKKKKPPPAPVSKTQAAKEAKIHLSVGDGWAHKYFDPNDFHCRDRLLFGS